MEDYDHMTKWMKTRIGLHEHIYYKFMFLNLMAPLLYIYIHYKKKKCKH